MYDEEVLGNIEQALICVIDSSDSNEMHVAQEYILHAIESNECFTYFIAIIMSSAEPKAKNQAAIQFLNALRIKLPLMTSLTLNKIKLFIIQCFHEPSLDKVIIVQMVECARRIVLFEKAIWPEMEDFFHEMMTATNLFPLGVEVLSSAISFLKNQYVSEKYMILGQITTIAIKSNDWETMTNGIKLLSDLIGRSKSMAGFEDIFPYICALISNLQQQKIEQQTMLLNNIVSITKGGIFPPELISPLMAFIGNAENDESCALLALDAIDPVIKDFSIDQLFVIFNQVLIFSLKYIEKESAIPHQFMAIIETGYNYFPHSQVYAFIKQKITEIIPTNLALSVLLFEPTLSVAQEQLTNDSAFVLDIIRNGYLSNDQLVIEACTLVVTQSEDVEFLVQKFVDGLFPILLQLIVSPDDNVRQNGFSSLLSLMANHKKHPNILESIWNLRMQINENNFSQYLDSLGSAVSCSEYVDDEHVHQILMYLTPILSNQDIIVSFALYVIGHLVCIGEYSEIEDIIPKTLGAVEFCLNFPNEDAILHALSYVLNLISAYGDTINEFIVQIWPQIHTILVNKNIQRIKETALAIACQIAILCQQEEMLNAILELLGKELKNKHYENFLKSAAKISKILDPDSFLQLYSQSVEICKSVKSIEQILIGFTTLRKFLKHTPTKNQDQILQVTACIISMFFDGSLACLNGRSILNPDLDIDADLIDTFCDLIGKFVSYPSQYVESTCGLVLQLANRKEIEYKDCVIKVFIDAIENDTIQQTVALQLINNLGPLMTIQQDAVQQDIIYLLIVILKKYPTFIESLEPIMPLVSNMWEQSLTNKTTHSFLISNIASFYLNVACMSQQIPPEFLEQVMEFFPPSDLTEAQGMCECILKLFANPTAIGSGLRNKTAVGLAKLLSEPAKKLRKMEVSKDIFGAIQTLFKVLCSDQQTLGIVIGYFEKFEKRKQAILKLLS